RFVQLRIAKVNTKTPTTFFSCLIRLSTVALLLVCLMRPVLVVRAVEPQRNVLAVLVDDSRSMTIADQDSEPRSAFVREALRRVRRASRAALGAPLRARATSAFSSTDRARRRPRRRRRSPARARTSGQALAAHRRGTGGPAGVRHRAADRRRRHVRASRWPTRSASLQSAGLPVFAVGLGRETLARDVQLGRVDPPRRRC
ncbi:MAG: hypothetical protein MZU95_01330, partial [Desulfomicrobium escambiense]|nr:hypothetical protein [Desulfomicrobium escambiense]